ncbi:MAG: type II toxin-antitoxin system YafQ family toxin [Rhodocyclaceae bacterium]|jgi:mRNA interferase YafQ|nr:type II toxin-antitoxin system YafQ family toxin [Rhodocyclaceae bacterium]MCA3059227.1 type II toxin-antitoxin system YafQ family toxin [Rhodocyclaceae bacterium]MCA3081466.1 type II toxin-antitoxin system YafQ family toxin [Rhodocyclaceae bacterium]
MRAIDRTGQFKRDFKREAKGLHRQSLANALKDALQLLANDKPLSAKYRDHPLSGEWKDCRDCHIKPDLVLIYRKPNDAHLILIRPGSHSELGL